jgi:glycosyltransferase involved in cell wall biosynthesis
LVLPAKDEAAGLEASLRRAADELSRWPGGAEILVVDDGSRDATFAVAADLLERLPVPMRLHRHPENLGKGAAVRTGMLRTRGRLAGFTDVDLAYGLEPFREFAAAVDAGADVAVGRRTEGAKEGARSSRSRRLGHVAFARVVKAILDLPVSDSQAGMKMFRGDVARALFARSRTNGFAFDIEVLHLATRWGLEVVELDVPLLEASSPSTVRLLRHTPGMLLDVLRARVRRIPSIPAGLN